MTDHLSKEARSKNMSAIRSVSKLEDKISKALWSIGMRFRRNVGDLYGKPDFAIKKYKIVIFIDSCFWHGCDIHGNIPKSNQEYWLNKLARNKARDLEVTEFYTLKGWHVLRLWEHQFKKEHFEVSIEQIQSFINACKKEMPPNGDISIK